MKKMMLITLLLLVACTKPPEKVSFETVEDARRQVRENATIMATTYRKDTSQVASSLYVRGDSTQSAACPQGDGWASVDITSQYGVVTKLKCSTVSVGIGCMTDVDFKSKAYSQEDGICNIDIPFPLPKLNK